MNDAPRARYRHAAAAVGTRIFLFGGRDISDYLIPQVGLGERWVFSILILMDPNGS